jgi:3-dehydroquinate synthetase
MVYAAERSEALGHAPVGTAERLEALCARFGLPTRPPAFDRSAYLAALQVDKKKQASRIHYVVLEGVGSARTVPLSPSEIAAALPRKPTAQRRGRGAARGGAQRGRSRRRGGSP